MSAPNDAKSTWAQVQDLLCERRADALTIAAVSLGINALMLAPSMYMLQVYDRVMVGQNMLTLAASTLLLIAVLSTVAWLEKNRSHLLIELGLRFDQQFQGTLFEAIQRQELRSPQANPIQPLQDLAQVRQFITSHGLIALFDAPWFFIYGATLFMLHPMLGWVGVFFAAIHVVLMLRTHRAAAPMLETAAQAQVKVNAEQQSQLRNAQAIEVMGITPQLTQLWSRTYADWLQSSQTSNHSTQHRTAWTKLLRYSQQSASLGLGGWLVIQGEISTGAMIVTNILMTRMLQPLDAFNSTWRSWASLRGAMQRLHQAVTNTSTLPPVANPLSDDHQGIELRLDALSAFAPTASLDQPKTVLRDLSLVFPAGSVTAILGHSGAGKSTLARCLLGVWPLTNGQVYWNDIAIDIDHRPEQLEHVGYLPQTVQFAGGTVASNIARFGDVNPEAVVAAAKMGGTHDMILRLPKGYETPLGPQAPNLSSGQRQRIALARALYGGPKLLIMDEPDAHLDDEGEMALVAAIQNIKQQGCTAFLITHRQRLLATADRILVMHEGLIQKDQVLQPPALP